jgi:hypothetical protein
MTDDKGLLDDFITPRQRPRMTLGRLLLLAASRGGPSGYRHRTPRYMHAGEATPPARQPAVRFDGVIEAPVPRGVA